MLEIIQRFISDLTSDKHNGTKIRELVSKELRDELIKFVNDSLVGKFISETIFYADKSRIKEVDFSDISKKFIISAEETSYLVTSNEISELIENGGIETERINLYLLK